MENRRVLNVLYICIGASMGGSTQSLLDTLSAMRGYVKPVVILKAHYAMENILNDIGVKTYVIPFEEGYGPISENNVLKADGNLVKEYEAAVEICKVIEIEKIDIVHTSGSTTNVGAISALLMRIPHIFHVRELLEEHFGLEYWDKRLKKQLYANSSNVIAISNSVRNSLKKKYGVDSCVIYNPIDDKRYVAEDKLRDLSSNVFLIAGTISLEKGQLDVLKAVNLLKEQKITNLKLIIMGEADYRNDWIIRNYIKNKGLSELVEYRGFQNNITEWRKRAVFSITASKMEAFGRSTAEGMLAGLLTIGANTGGTKELIGVNGERGLLYEQGDYISLSEAMKCAICMSEFEKKEIRQRAYEYIHTNCSLNAYAKQLLDVYKKCMEASYTVEANQLRLDLIERYNSVKNIVYNSSSIINRTDYYTKEIFYKWITLMHKGEKVADYFVTNEYKKIAIYGMGAVGCSLYDELLCENDIMIEFVMDRNLKGISEITKAVEIGDKVETVDCIVVCVAGQENYIKELLQQKYEVPILGISEIINSFMF